MLTVRMLHTFVRHAGCAAILRTVLVGAAFGLMASCSRPAPENRVVIWHQMRPDERDILRTQLERYMSQNPGIEVVELYKETEELRSGFIVASIAGQGPDLVYGPSDPVGIYEATKLGGEQEPSSTNREPPRFRGNPLGKSITPKGYF